MTITAQPGSGEIHYRQKPDDPHIVQIQRKPGARWARYGSWSTAGKARFVILMLARGIKVKEEGEAEADA